MLLLVADFLLPSILIFSPKNLGGGSICQGCPLPAGVHSAVYLQCIPELAEGAAMRDQNFRPPLRGKFPVLPSWWPSLTLTPMKQRVGRTWNNDHSDHPGVSLFHTPRILAKVNVRNFCQSRTRSQLSTPCSTGRMATGDKLERVFKEVVVTYSDQWPRFSLKKLTKITKQIIQDSLQYDVCLGWKRRNRRRRINIVRKRKKEVSKQEERTKKNM
jgi:hypothetical protein